MKNEFITYNQALALKELGFNKPCFAYYGKQETMMGLLYSNIYNGNVIENCIAKPSPLHLDVYAPLYQQAFRWFREKHGLMHIINPYNFTAEIDYLNKRVVDEKYGDFIPHDHLIDEEGEEIKYSFYEEAEQACLDKLIEIVKNKN